MPALGNVAAVCAFFAGSALSARVADDPDTATFVVAPVLLMLHEDGALFTSLRGARRYAPPLAAAATQLLGAALSDARTFGFGAPESELRAAAAAAWGAGEERSALARWRTFLTEAFLALAAAPCAWRLTEYLWSPSRRARRRDGGSRAAQRPGAGGGAIARRQDAGGDLARVRGGAARRAEARQARGHAGAVASSAS